MLPDWLVTSSFAQHNGEAVVMDKLTPFAPQRGRRVVKTGQRATAVAFSHDGGLLAIATTNGRIMLYRTSDYWLLLARDLDPGNAMYDSTSYQVHAMKFSPVDEKVLVLRRGCMNYDRIIFFSEHNGVWEIDQTKSIVAADTRSKHNRWEPIAFSPDGDLLITKQKDNVLLGSIMPNCIHSKYFCALDEGVDITCTAVSPDNQFVAAGTDKGTIHLWRAVVPLTVYNFEHYEKLRLMCLRFVPTGVDFNYTISTWHETLDVATDKGEPKITARREQSRYGRSSALSAHLKKMSLIADTTSGGLVASSDGTYAVAWINQPVKVFGEKERSFVSACHNKNKVVSAHVLDNALVKSVEISPAINKQLAMCDNKGTVTVFPACEWSDRTHRHFNREIKRMVFFLMCLRQRLDRQKKDRKLTLTSTTHVQVCVHHCIPRIPRIPMEMWLCIFAWFQYMN